MPRVISNSLINALTKSNIRVVRAIEIFFPSMTLRLWNGRSSRVINGETFYPGGALLTFSDVEEVGDIEATGTKVTLSGLDRSIVSLALSEPFQGSEVNLYFGETSTDDVVQIGSGILDKMDIDDSVDTVSITISIESALLKLNESDDSVFTQADHDLRYPEDLFLEFVTDLADKTITW